MGTAISMLTTSGLAQPQLYQQESHCVIVYLSIHTQTWRDGLTLRTLACSFREPDFLFPACISAHTVPGNLISSSDPCGPCIPMVHKHT